MSEAMGVLGRIRQPEYTGENRCLPCTVVNSVITVVLAAIAGGLAWQFASPAAGGAAAFGVLAIGAAAIYLRGYLVPGTPSLTKRYFPEWLLARFGKASATTATQEAQSPADEALDPETVLMDAGALEECADGTDLCLTEDFRTAWYDEVEAIDADDAAGRDRLLELLEVDGTEVELEEYGEAFRAFLDGQPVGTWQSEAAYLADLGAGRALADRYDGWADLSVGQRGRLLNGLRLFIDRCPSCGDVPEFGTETVESCCSTHEVAAVECAGCGARLFETRT